MVTTFPLKMVTVLPAIVFTLFPLNVTFAVKLTVPLLPPAYSLMIESADKVPPPTFNVPLVPRAPTLIVLAFNVALLRVMIPVDPLLRISTVPRSACMVAPVMLIAPPEETNLIAPPGPGEAVFSKARS